MKKFLLLVLVIMIFNGCRKDKVDNTTLPPSKIDGLELTFIINGIHGFQGNFRAICFLDEYEGYIGGYDGVMYRTKDGGVSWDKLITNTDLPLYDIFFINKEEGFAVGGKDHCGGTGCVPEGAIIIHTTDGGQTWNQIPLSLTEKIELESIFFVNNSIGYTVGNGLILSTKDGGMTWQELIINDLGGVMMDIEFLNEKNGFIASTKGRLLKTTDGGINWDVSTPFHEMGGYTLAKTNESVIYSAGYTGIMKSSNHGITWSNLQDCPTNIWKLVFTTDELGFAFGQGAYTEGSFDHSSGSIYYTTDGGNTWLGNGRIHELSTISAASFPLTNIGYALSPSGIVKIVKR